MATKKMLTLPSQKLVLPTQLPWDVTQKRMIGNPTFTPDWKQITGGSGVTYSLKDMWWQDTPYTTTEVAGVKGWPTSTPPPTESLDSILANNRSAQGSSTPTSNARGATNVSTYSIPNAKLLAQSGWQSDSLPWAINPEDKIPWVYYPTPLPTPNTPTPTNPVTKISLQKAVPIAPDIAQIQQMDINNLNDTIDKLQIKQSKEQLSDEELLTLRRATRQLQQSMTPQSLTWWLDEMIAKKETNIIETTNKLDKQNEQELAQFKQSQEAYKQSEIQAIEQADEEQKKTLWYILWAQGAGTSSFWAEQINKITQNSLQKKQVLAQAVQAKIDLYGSQLRKDSQETIQNLQTNLDNLYMKAAEFDVENIKELNAFNKEQWASKIKEIDWLMALAQSQALSSKELTPEEQKQVDTFANNLYDENGNFKEDVFKMLKEINPNLANLAVYNGGAIQKQRIADNLAMKWLDADIKRAQLNKLLNPDVDYKVTANDDWTYTRTGSDWSVAIVNPVWSTDVWWLSWADLAKTLASGKIDWKKFFGVYATGDPDGTQFASIYNKVAEQWLDAYMKSRQDRGSKITADMVNQAAIATGVDPITIAAKMAQDSWMGTQGKGARNNNPWNVGQFDSLDAKWITVKGYSTLEDWVLAVADNFKKRQDALLSVAPQKKTSTDTNKIYQILTEAGQADWVAKNNAKTLASSGKTIEQIQQEYPNKDDQYRIRDVTDSVSKAYESFNKSNTKLGSIMRILKDPNASGKSIEVALKSFVSAIDNTAAMAGEVAQARDAWLSDIDALQARLIKIGSWKVKESIRKDIENTISQFHTWIQWAYDDYLSTQQWSIKTQYWDIRANKLDLYKRAWANQSQTTTTTTGWWRRQG